MTSVTSKSWFLRLVAALFFVAVGVFLSFAALLLWLRNYPHPDDPKNIDYVLWKYGLNENMNPDTALRAMTHDNWPVQRVAGLSEQELEKRFGYIRTPDSASRIGGCYNAESLRHPGAYKVVSLRDSLWIVTLENGKAVDLVLCKGS